MNTTAPPLTMMHHQRLLKQAALASICVALVLVAVKTWALHRTGSISVLASLLDSILDSLASIISAFAVRYSLTPPDDEHRFGHGKAQALAGLVQAGVIGASAVFLFSRAVQRMLNPQDITDAPAGIAAIGFALVLTAVLVVFQRYVVRQTESVAIKADSAHYWSDFLANGVVLIALAVSGLGWFWLDPLLALGIAVYIVWSAFEVGSHAAQELMDRELALDIQHKIEQAAEAVAGVHDVHDLRTRRAGHVDIIQMHVVLDDQLTLIDAHEIADRVEDAVRAIRPGADVIIHQDPLSVARAEGHDARPAVGSPS